MVAAKQNDSPPPEVYLALMCDRWKALPDEILEQDVGLLNRMYILDDVYMFARRVSKIKMKDRQKELSSAEYNRWLNLNLLIEEERNGSTVNPANNPTT